MKRINAILFVSLLVLSTGLFAQDQSEIKVEEIAVCKSVENRTPVGIDSVFSSDIGKLYCYTKLKSQNDKYTISHVWFYNNKQMTKIDLNVKLKSWRTWSAKTIYPKWTGDWRVEVQDSNGNVLSKIAFKIK